MFFLNNISLIYLPQDNMHSEFTKRCLYRSITFLNSLQIPSSDILLTPLDQHLIASFHSKDYKSISVTVCQTTCDCCSQHHKFLSSYALTIHTKLINSPPSNIFINPKDPFSPFLQTINDITCILNLLKVEFFYEAFEILLLHITQANFNIIETEIETVIKDEILKRIYFMLIYIFRFYKCQLFQDYFDDLVMYFKIEHEYDYPLKQYKSVVPARSNEYIKALLAAVLYVDKQYDKSVMLFEKLEGNSYHFMDFYSNLLYVKGSLKQLALLSISLNSMYPLRPETYVCMGNYQSSRKDSISAIECFEKAVKLDERFTAIHTLIAHEYIELKDSKSAIFHFNKAIAFNKNDFRAIFGMGDVLKNCGYVHIAVLLYTRAVELQNDNGYCWLVLGNAFMNLKRYENALRCFKRASLLGEDDALRCIGDCLRRLKKYEEAVKAYERFVEVKGKEDIVCGFLAEYYENKGNYERSMYYKVEKGSM